MKEKDLRDDIVQMLALKGWTCWWPGRVKFKPAQDIFTLWDIIAAKGSKIRFIQLTTKNNVQAHVMKINKYRTLYGVTYRNEIWGWSQKKMKWEIIKL